MSDTFLSPFSAQRRSNWVRLRTMILLRWMAIFGQLSAILIAITFYRLQLELALCLVAISISVVGNLSAMFIFPKNKRLSEFENMMMILFDVLQLSFLLYLTGGLQNPFSILLLGPVAVSASVLTLRSSLILGGTAIILATILAVYHLPLKTEQGLIFSIPDVFVFGKWIAVIIALLFLSVNSRWVTSEMNAMGEALLATQMALSREQQLADLNGVVAAAAHELGTPLATIKLASSELMEELRARPELFEDASLIREQADRCRDILRSMGRNGKADLHLRAAPISDIIREAAEPHQGRGVVIQTSFECEEGMQIPQPIIQRRPEIIHGLRNMVQNAVDFGTSKVLIEATWSTDRLLINILDDGPGFPLAILDRIGDPFMGTRKPENDGTLRSEYEGMGLGLFIAKTLLERTGGELSFSNGDPKNVILAKKDYSHGALVAISWSLRLIEQKTGALGENEALVI